MSSTKTITITCPKCKTEHPFKIWKSINTMFDPEMKAAVRDKSAFLFECPNCGDRNYVDYGTLYHQMEDKIMIQYAQTDEDAEEIYKLLYEEDPERNEIFHNFRKENYLIRIVRSQNELREKLGIFDAGLDDRIIEIIKLFVLAEYQKMGTTSNNIRLYYLRSDGKDVIELYVDNEYGGNYTLPEGMYESVRKDYAGRIPDIRKDDPLIDRQWALEHFSAGKRKDGR